MSSPMAAAGPVTLPNRARKNDIGFLAALSDPALPATPAAGTR